GPAAWPTPPPSALPTQSTSATSSPGHISPTRPSPAKIASTTSSAPVSSQRRRSVSRKPSGGTRDPALPCTGSTITQPASSGSGPGSSPYARRYTGPGSHGTKGSRNRSKPVAASGSS